MADINRRRRKVTSTTLAVHNGKDRYVYICECMYIHRSLVSSTFKVETNMRHDISLVMLKLHGISIDIGFLESFKTVTESV